MISAMRILLFTFGTVLLAAVLLFSPSTRARMNDCSTCHSEGNQIYEMSLQACLAGSGEACQLKANYLRCQYMVTSCSPCEAAVIACDF